MIYYEVDIVSNKLHNSVETIYSGDDLDEACDVMREWDNAHPNETDLYTDIYHVEEDERHGVGKWK